MASKATSIPRFLLPQSSPMWRAATTRPLDVGQVITRHITNAASKSTKTKGAIAGQRSYSKKSSAASKAAKHSAPTKPPSDLPGVVKLTPKGPVTPKASAASAKTVEPIAKPVAAESQPTVKTVAPKPKTPPSPAKPAATPKVDPSKPIVLEKPARFNPPSHGSRLPRSTPRHYGGPMTTEEVQAQARKSYPGLPPPPNTWSHWFIHSRGVHTFITLGTLTSLAAYVWVQNFKAKSPYMDMIPDISEFPRHPFQYIGTCLEVLRMTEEHESAQTAEKRRRRVEDVGKRNEYRKAHGMEPANKGIFGARAEVAEDVAETPGAASAAAVVDSSTPEPNVPAEATEGRQKKKFLGIF
ncbi:hypothetical protein GGS20DRAFT_101715 [Poronia punctata]|nr:hypothetical protein GGS20DRAFT_101715 [Poronia punctata]